MFRAWLPSCLLPGLVTKVNPWDFFADNDAAPGFVYSALYFLFFAATVSPDESIKVYRKCYHLSAEND